MIVAEAVDSLGVEYSAEILRQAQQIWEHTEFLNALDVTDDDSRFDDEYVEKFLRVGITGVALCISKCQHDFEDTLRAFLKWNRLVGSRTNLVLVRTVGDLDRALRDRKLGVFWALDRMPVIRAIEPGYIRAFGDQEDALRLLYDLGLRMSQLANYGGNVFGDGAGEPRDAGLTELGELVIRSMNELGITVDLAHAGHRTCLEAIDTSEFPVVISHAGCRALTSHPRNIDDDVIAKAAARGGMIGLDLIGNHILVGGGPYRQPTIEDWLRHLDHVVELVGIDYVGFGPDSKNRSYTWEGSDRGMRAAFPRFFESEGRLGPKGELGFVKGMTNPLTWPAIFPALLARGYTREDIGKVMGGNFRRVLTATWH